ncbi:MAG: DNA-binding protein [Streptococcus pyogenes]|nr:MAG: DNA-binding protein [Streptococcus pyogenes]
MMFIALIADIVASKQLANRQQFQAALIQTLERLNKDYTQWLVSPFTVTLGDEFQALFVREVPIFEIIDQLNRYLAPVTIRYGIGVGDILTTINSSISLGADGPAYWHARRAIQYIHQKNDYGNTQVRISGEEKDVYETINTLLAAGEAIKSNWRSSQEELLVQLLEHKDYSEHFNQQDLGRALHLQPSALSKRLKSSNLKVYLRTRHQAQSLISKGVDP